LFLFWVQIKAWKSTDLLVLLFWIFSFGLGMVVGIFGIATASMGISYSKIKKKSVFEVAYKKVMKMVK